VGTELALEHIPRFLGQTFDFEQLITQTCTHFSTEELLILDFPCCQTLEELINKVVIPVMESTVQNVQGYLVDQDVDDPFMQERPLFIADCLQNQDEGVDKDDALASRAFLAKLLPAHQFQVIQIVREVLD
jgi:hypothetical protein